MTTRKFLVIYLIGLALAAACVSAVPPLTLIYEDDDDYDVHSFPSNREVCSSFNTICWVRVGRRV